MARGLLVLLMLWLAVADAGAADLPKPPDLPAAAAPAAAEPPSIQGFGVREPSCEEWTDACRACQRAADGAPSCSNIGIACQPREVTCTRRRDGASAK